ncbi:uncharacterized protein LOC107000406 [Macaca mulatta]
MVAPQFALSSVFPPARNQCSLLVVWPRSFAVPRYRTPSHTITHHRKPPHRSKSADILIFPALSVRSPPPLDARAPGVSHDCCPMCVRGVLWESMDSEVPASGRECWVRCVPRLHGMCRLHSSRALDHGSLRSQP